MDSSDRDRTIQCKSPACNKLISGTDYSRIKFNPRPAEPSPAFANTVDSDQLAFEEAS